MYKELLENLSKMNEFAMKAKERMIFADASEIADTIKKHLILMGIDENLIEYGGSLRREAATVGDVDIVIFDDSLNKNTWEELISGLKDAGYSIEQQYTDAKGKKRAMPLGDTQASFLFDGNNVDVKKHTPDKRGSMMIHVTGSAQFNIGMRAWLKTFGWSFSQEGLKNEKGGTIAAFSEEGIFEKLGMEFIESKERIRFPVPKKLPPEAIKGVDVAPTDIKSVETPQEGSFKPDVPDEIYKKLPQNVKDKLEDYELPRTDDAGRPVPRNLLVSKSARHQYYKGRGTIRIPDLLKLDRY